MTKAQQETVCITNQLITILTYHNSIILGKRSKYEDTVDEMVSEIEKVKHKLVFLRNGTNNKKHV